METKKKSGRFVITQRDLELVGWLGRVKLARVEQVQERFGMARSKAYGRLQGLREIGLVRLDDGVPGPGVFLATRKGLALAQVELGPAAVSLESLRHDLEAAKVAAEVGWWTHKTEARLLAERELRAHQQCKRDDRYRIRVDERGGASQRWHGPDLALEYEDQWLAIEVELTQKSAARLEQILVGYRRSGRYTQHGPWGVVYLVRGAARVDQLVDLAAKVALTPESHPVLLVAQELREGAAVAAVREALAGRRIGAQRAAERLAEQEQRAKHEAARRMAEAAELQARREQRAREEHAAYEAAQAEQGRLVSRLRRLAAG